MSMIKLPPKVKKGDPVYADDYNSLIDALQSVAMMPGVGYLVRRTMHGTALEIRPAKKATDEKKTGPFCKVYTDGDPATWYLLGGTVTGGSGNETVAPISMGAVGSEPADGTHFWLQVTIAANYSDGLLMPGGDVTAVTTGSGATVPGNTIPTYDSPTGTLYISLGEWSEGEFSPAACGNIEVGHCPGSLTSGRTS